MNDDSDREFSSDVISTLGHYVYALADSGKNLDDPLRYFYVGKGQGNRCFQHAAGSEAIDNADGTDKVCSPKLDVIRGIRERGDRIEVRIVAHDLNEDTAFSIEAIILSLFRDLCGLANLQGGHGADRFWRSPRELEERYGTPLTRKDLPAACLLVNVKHSAAGAAQAPGIGTYDERHSGSLDPYRETRAKDPLCTRRDGGKDRQRLQDPPGARRQTGVQRGAAGGKEVCARDIRRYSGRGLLVRPDRPIRPR